MVLLRLDTESGLTPPYRPLLMASMTTEASVSAEVAAETVPDTVAAEAAAAELLEEEEEEALAKRGKGKKKKAKATRSTANAKPVMDMSPSSYRGCQTEICIRGMYGIDGCVMCVGRLYSFGRGYGFVAFGSYNTV